MALLYVNADDFGLHESVNHAIQNAVKTGSVNSISVMANGQAPDYLMLRQLQVYAFVGAHITWVNEPWLTKPYHFHSWKELLVKLLTGGQQFKKELEQEGDAQVQILQSKNIPLDHIDSHQHVHLFPGIWEITLALQKKYQIERIRVPSTSSILLARKNLGGIALQLLASQKQPTKNPIHCIGIKNAGHYDIDSIKPELAKAAGHDTMFIVHPGINNKKLNGRYSSWHFDWEKEYNMLMSLSFQKAIEKNGFTMAKR